MSQEPADTKDEKAKEAPQKSKGKEADAPKKKSPMIKRILFVLLPFILLALYVGNDVNSFLGAVPSNTPQEKIFLITPGSSFQFVADNLYEENLITDVRSFIIYAKYRGITDKVRSGRFALSTGWTPVEVIDHLMTAKPKLETITIPEGLPWWEIAKRFDKAGLIRFEDFKKTIHNRSFLRYWGIPFTNAEGFLFPDTYKFLKPLELNERNAQNIIGRLIDNFWRRTAHIWPGGKRPTKRQEELLRHIVILASIVEKETADPLEHNRIAGVYANRLKRKMRMQADPTTIYGLGVEFDGNLTKKHLQDRKNPYNTYRLHGLPPAPICSPGLASIEASRKPEAHEYLYFVAQPTGAHYFSKNLNDHNRAVNLYQKRRRGDTFSLLPNLQ